jgi:fatty acid-binding protein DegV
MLLIRIAAILTAIIIGSGIFAYLVTRDRRYLRLSGRVAKWALILVLIVLVLMFLERLIRL